VSPATFTLALMASWRRTAITIIAALAWSRLPRRTCLAHVRLAVTARVLDSLATLAFVWEPSMWNLLGEYL
jgi:hypothetical protein